MSKISFVVPILNEETLIPRLHSELSQVTQDLRMPCEIIYVDDGSDDHSLPLLLKEQETNPDVIVVELSRNWGHQSALTAGLSVATGDAVVLIDGDLQDPPGVIPDLVGEWKGGAQVVIARRRSRAESGLRRVLFQAFYRALGFLSDYPIPLDAGIFGLIDRQVVDELLRLSEVNRYLPGLRAWLGFKTRVVLYDRAARQGGEPKQSLPRLIRYAFDAIFSFSYKPLRLSLVGGITIAAFAILYGVVLVVCRLMNVGLFGIPVVDGYTSTIVSLLLLGAIQLMSIGILGEYIGRIYDEVKRRPLFVIHRIHGAQDSNSGSST